MQLFHCFLVVVAVVIVIVIFAVVVVAFAFVGCSVVLLLFACCYCWLLVVVVLVVVVFRFQAAWLASELELRGLHRSLTLRTEKLRAKERQKFLLLWLLWLLLLVLLLFLIRARSSTFLRSLPQLMFECWWYQ
ncbi:unnamed protein product [Polarella glacialis]|uniref:Transmembrane protein n=1 Tax=Polarella glacialis TaxID=89957 RepID=A0A813KVY5_POLGL|nr:unnamed protein product [Polarella glacialis]